MKKRTREILTNAAIGALVIAALVVTGIFLDVYKTQPAKKEAQGKLSGPLQSAPQIVTERIILGEQLLIKGCLFNLGIARENVRITGRTVEVTLEKELKESRIREAFASFDDLEGVEISFQGPGKVVVAMNSHEWELIFRVRVPEREKPLASIAIIIDDMGIDMNIARQLGAIDADLTFSVLPQQPHTEEVARLLHGKGREILLHLPMEGNGKNPGAGAIYRSMDPSQAGAILLGALKEVPFAVGVNNHMGSAVTPDEAIMKEVLTIIKDRGLFFVDSLTIGSSVGGEVASEIHLPFEARDVFLDNEQTYPYIAGQLEQLVAAAKRHGKAIGICHPHPVTAQVLAREIPKLKDRGIALVRVSSLVRNRI